MFKFLAAAAALLAAPAFARIEPFPAGFRTQMVQTNQRLVRGRERIYLARFWNELSANPRMIDEETRRHYARLYAQPRTGGIVPNSGHWIMEENPQATVKLVTEFLAK